MKSIGVTKGNSGTVGAEDGNFIIFPTFNPVTKGNPCTVGAEDVACTFWGKRIKIKTTKNPVDAKKVRIDFVFVNISYCI